MATLMRRGLEECDSLAEVKALWQNNPRTCEYYYVFADGEDRSAVGVAATPEKLQFVAPGEVTNYSVMASPTRSSSRLARDWRNFASASNQAMASLTRNRLKS